MVKEAKGITDKEELSATMQKVISQSQSMDDFLARLKEQGIESYERDGITTGVWLNNRKYRFKTVGIEKHQFQKFKEEEVGKEIKPIDQTISDIKIPDILSQKDDTPPEIVINTAGVQDIDAITLSSNEGNQKITSSPSPRMHPNTSNHHGLSAEEIELQELQDLRDNAQELSQGLEH